MSRDFESNEVRVLAFVDWRFQMNSYLNALIWIEM